MIEGLDGAGDGGVLGAGDGDDVGTGLGAGVAVGGAAGRRWRACSVAVSTETTRSTEPVNPQTVSAGAERRT